MNAAPINTPAEPDLNALLRQRARNLSYQLNCHEVGNIVSFDADKQTAVVQIAVLRVLGNRNVPYPLLKDCPVFVHAGADGCVTMPVAAGDTCLVLFNDRDLDNWFTSGSIALPNSDRAHDLSDGMVLVGFRHLGNPIQDYSTTDAELRCGSGRFGVGPEGKLSLRNNTGSLRESLDELFDGLDTALDGINALCTALTGWVDTGGQTPNPATVTAINNAKATIADGKATVDDAKTATDAILK